MVRHIYRDMDGPKRLLHIKTISKYGYDVRELPRNHSEAGGFEILKQYKMMYAVTSFFKYKLMNLA